MRKVPRPKPWVPYYGPMKTGAVEVPEIGGYYPLPPPAGLGFTQAPRETHVTIEHDELMVHLDGKGFVVKHEHGHRPELEDCYVKVKLLATGNEIPCTFSVSSWWTLTIRSIQIPDAVTAEAIRMYRVLNIVVGGRGYETPSLRSMGFQ